MNETKRSFLDLAWLILALAAFGAFGAIAKELIRWDPVTPWQRRIGSAMTSLGVSFAVGFYVNDLYPDRLGLILAASSLATWGGNEAYDLLWKLLKSYGERMVEQGKLPTAPARRGKR